MHRGATYLQFHPQLKSVKEHKHDFGPKLSYLRNILVHIKLPVCKEPTSPSLAQNNALMKLECRFAYCQLLQLA
jgi:hypothetical protein